jgi:hypothetical protein
MADNLMLLALFADIDPATAAIDKLREMGIKDDGLEIISGVPFNQHIFGRPKVSTFIPRLAIGGALVGLASAVFLIEGIPLLFPLHVGGQPVFPIPPLFIVAFEMTMLGLMGAAFIGLFIAGRLPSYEEKIYVPEVSDGKIALIFQCSVESQTEFEQAMTTLGAEFVRPVEAKTI